MLHLRVIALVGLLLSSVTATSPKAQIGASLSGTVRDVQGDVVPNAVVRLAAPGAGLRREAVSRSDGAFEFAGLPLAMSFELSAEAPGLVARPVTIDGLSAGERRMVSLTLAAALDVSVRVVAAEGPVQRSVSPALGGQVTAAQVARLPINGRDLLSVAYLVPGAAPARGFYNLAPRLTINGASSLTANYTVDGFDNTDLFLGGPKVPVTIGATENVRVLVNAYAPEHGRTGNGVFSVTTRAGSNRAAGEVFYTWRPGAAIDAPNFFAPRDGTGAIVDDSFRRHQTGGHIGGAVVADRLFYFADGEVTRERQDAILTSPLAAGLAPTRFDSQALTGKLDARWSDQHSTTVRYQFSDLTHDGDAGFIGGLTLPSAGLQVSYRNQVASLSHRAIAAGGVNELGVMVGQLRADWRPLAAGPRVVITDRGATLATIGGVSDNFFWTETDLQVRDVHTWTAGRHTLRAGVDVLRGDFTIRSGPGARGAYVVDVAGRAVTPAGPFVTVADLPRDVAVLSYSQSFVNPAVSRAQTLAATFVEDAVRASSNLTLTLGARWDYDSATHTPVNDGDTNNVAPRLGVSWTPSGSPRHQVRGGYGWFYERIPFAVVSDTIFNDPNGGAVSVTFAPGTAFSPPSFPDTVARDAVGQLPLAELPPRNVQVFDPALRSPRTEQVSIGYILSVSDTLAVAVDAVHARGRNLIRRVDVNAPASVSAGVTRTVADADATRPTVPAAGGVRLVEQDQSSGRSEFDGLYLTVRRPLARGVAFDIAYTLSRTRNDTDDINFRPVDSRRPGDEWGPSLNDRRHVLAAHGLVQIENVFDVVPVLFLSSGQPLNITTGRDDNGDTIFNDRPAGVGRNSERTTGFVQFDLSLLRDVRVGRARVQLRADVFNVFNRTNFSGFFNFGASGVRPDENGTLAFQPTAAGPARQFQFGASVRF
ncbi:MAG: carboxypeptidase regulatory-like domain-containing protein [Vicinamibacterales bacterium]